MPGTGWEVVVGSGGARARSGPPPDPGALRRNRGDDAEWLTLPASHDLAAPEWPLVGLSTREAELWRVLWLKPQAVAWHRFDMAMDVALYVRRFAEAELPDSSVSLSTLVRQLADSLGISVPGMRANRWRVGEPVPVEDAPAVDRVSARDRLRVLSNGAG